MDYPKNRIEAAVYFTSKGKRVLDVGCGYGELLNRLENKFDELYGIELQKGRVNVAKERVTSDKYRIIEGSIEEKCEFSDNFFDTVINTDVIEHVYDIFKAFGEMKRVLKSGGRLLTITPNIADIRRRLTLLSGRFPSTSAGDEGFSFRDGTTNFDGGHIHYFTYSMVEKLYRLNGFINIKRYGFGRFGRLHNILPSLFSPACLVIGEKKG